MIKNIRHTGVVVEDIDQSLRFYRDLLGFKVTKQMEESGGYIDNMLALKGIKVTTIKMTLPDGQMIEMLKYHSHPRQGAFRDSCEVGISHIAFTVDNLDKEYDRLKKEGIKFNAPPQHSPDGYAKVTFCRAPEGTLVELVEVLK